MKAESIMTGRKYWIRENFYLPVFDRFKSFGKPWTQFIYFRTGIRIAGRKY